MEEYNKVLITTGGLGSRLGNLAQFTNKGLVKVGDKAALSHIIESYNAKIEFIITLGHFGFHVKQFLKIAYPNHNFKFVNVKKYYGPGSSLLYSISCAKKFLQSKFIFHACDTIIDKNFITKINFKNNWLAGYKSQSSQSYRTFNVLNKQVIKLNDKGEENYDYIYIGIAGIKNYIAFWESLEKILNINNSTNLSDYHAINDMISKEKFILYECNFWYDTGNIDSLIKAKQKYKPLINALNKDGENIFIAKNKVIKFFYNKEICRNRVKRSKILGNLVPKVVGYTPNFYTYNFVKGKVFSEDLDTIKFEKLLKWAKSKLWLPKKINNKEFKENAIKFYKNKTLNRVNSFLDKNNLVDNIDVINKLQVPTIKSLINKINFNNIIGHQATGFHGDFILDNILIKKNKNFILMDWRQDFNGKLTYGDVNYDIAKLNHNLLFNHDLINKDDFSIKIKKEIFLDLLIKKSSLDCQKLLINFCKRNDISFKAIEILTSLIWINMAPLHEHPLDLFLYFFGKYNLFINTDFEKLR